MRVWRTAVIIYTDYDPAQVELDDLARDAISGESICTQRSTEPEELDLPTDEDSEPLCWFEFVS